MALRRLNPLNLLRSVHRHDPLSAPDCSVERMVFGPGAEGLKWAVVTDKGFGGSSAATWQDGTFAGAFDKQDGFAAVKATLPRQLGEVEGFAGLAVRVKSDGRPYAIGFRPASSFSDDLYQAFVTMPASAEWVLLELAFADLTLSGGGGRVREAQRRLDGGRLNSIIISAGGIGAPVGPFRLSIDWIKWGRNVEPKPGFSGEDEE